MPESTPRSVVVLANAILSGAALSIGMVLAAAVWRLPPSMTTIQLVVYYVVPLCAVGLLGASLRLSGGTKVNLALVVLSVGFALIAAEAFLRIMTPFVPEDVARRTGGVFDARSRAELAAALASEGIEAYPNFPAWATMAVRLSVDGEEIVRVGGGLANTLTIFCRDGGQWLTYVSDEHGFNNDPGSWDDEVDVVVIGDSFAQGYCVERDDNIASRLREVWPATLSLGQTGAGPLLELAILREYGATLQPSRVLWLYYEGNDHADLAFELQDPVLVRYRDEGFRQRIPERQAELDRALRQRLDDMAASPILESERPDVWERLDGWRLLRMDRLQSVLLGATVPFPAPQSRIQPVVEILAEARRTVRGWGGELYVVYLPWYARYAGRIADAGTERQELLDGLARLEIPVIDVVEAFGATSDPTSLWLHPAAHYSPAGYRVVADAIINHFRAAR